MSIELIGIAAVGATLSKHASTLIEKVSDAVGGLCAPWQIKRVRKSEAKGEAAAALIKATSDIETTDLHQRAVRRSILEEAQQQKNMEAILTKAVPQLNEKAKPESMENDWIVNFFDKSRIVSDDEMQRLWSRLLAGEANAPGTYSKRTVNFISDLDKDEANLFTQFCGFVAQTIMDSGFLEPLPLVFDDGAKIYETQGIDFMGLQHLDSIGLIKFESSTGLHLKDLPKRVVFSYGGRPLVLVMEKDTNNTLEIGKTLLTRIGKELFPICGSKPLEGFLEYVKDHWKQYLPKPEPEYGIAPGLISVPWEIIQLSPAS